MGAARLCCAELRPSAEGGRRAVAKTPDRVEQFLDFIEQTGDPPQLGQIGYVSGAFRLKDSAGVFDPRSGGGGITEAQHKALLQLIHFIDEGPAEGFASGATKTVTGTVFPTQELWFRADATKIVEKNITWTGALPTTIEYKIYAADGSTVLATVSDAITYSGVFETGRTRTLS